MTAQSELLPVVPVPQDMEAVEQLMSALRQSFDEIDRECFNDNADDAARWQGMIRWLFVMRQGLAMSGLGHTVAGFEHVSSTITALAYRQPLPVRQLPPGQVQKPQRDFAAQMVGRESAQMLLVAHRHSASQDLGANLVAAALKRAGFIGRKGSIGRNTVIDWLVRHEDPDAKYPVDKAKAEKDADNLRTDAHLIEWLDREISILKSFLKRVGQVSKYFR